MRIYLLGTDDFPPAGPSQLLWIEICQRANVDPRELVESKLDDLLKVALDATHSNVGGLVCMRIGGSLNQALGSTVCGGWLQCYPNSHFCLAGARDS